MIHRLNTELYDLAVIGGGVVGLWAARHAVKRGERVVLYEKRRIGSGASGGFLGALMPHMPDSWNPKKQLQFEGLASLPKIAAELKDETGIDCCYRRCGRIMPVTNQKLTAQMPRRINGAAAYWTDGYSLEYIEQPESEYYASGWINQTIASFGVQKDDLSARINPRQYVSALFHSLQDHVDFEIGREVTELTADGRLLLDDGGIVSAGKVIVANGYEAYPILQPYMGAMSATGSVGRGVKGQAVLLEFEHNDELPIVYHDGSYVVPHAGNRVAIGSTSVNQWAGQSADSFVDDDMGFYESALKLVPALQNAPIIGKWAGVRPRNTLDGRGTEPYAGPIPGCKNAYALIGGFKITLGIAHVLGASI